MKTSVSKNPAQKVSESQKVTAKQLKSTAIEIAKTFKISNNRLIDIADEGKDETCPQCGLELINGLSCPQCGAVSEGMDGLTEEMLEPTDEPFDDNEPFEDPVDDEMTIDVLNAKEEILSLFREYGLDYNHCMKDPDLLLIPKEMKESIKEIIARQGSERLTSGLREDIVPAIRFWREDEGKWRFSVRKLDKGYEQRYSLLEKTGEFLILKDRLNAILKPAFKHIPQADLRNYLNTKLKTDKGKDIKKGPIDNYISLLVTNKENLIQIGDRVFCFDEIFSSKAQRQEDSSMNKKQLEENIKNLIDSEDKTVPLSNRALAKKLGCSERGIRRILKELNISSSTERKINS